MDIQHIVRMANQIGSYFAAYPDAELARQEIAGHLRRFWEPRMRAAIRDHLASAEAHGLSPLVAAAVRDLSNS